MSTETLPGNPSTRHLKRLHHTLTVRANPADVLTPHTPRPQRRNEDEKQWSPSNPRGQEHFQQISDKLRGRKGGE